MSAWVVVLVNLEELFLMSVGNMELRLLFRGL